MSARSDDTGRSTDPASIKARVAARLSAIKSLEGVFPTSPSTTGAALQDWREVARDMQNKDIGLATGKSRDMLRSGIAREDLVESAVATFSGSAETREQVAGFARAGIGLFHGSQGFAASVPAERAARGGNAAISRVMLEGTRILLEPERVVVRFEAAVSGAERTSLLAKHALALIAEPGLPPDTVRAATTRGTALEVAVALMEESAIIFAEPDFIEHIGSRHVPNDPLYAQQWHHARLECEAAWDLTQGKGLTIAVIDNGFDRGHQDLAFGPRSGWFRQTPDLADADFIPGQAAMPDSNHGTACAGMIAAKAGNAIGGCGVAFGSKLTMIACLGDQVGTQVTLARAIAYAADPGSETSSAAKGADVIACSLGPNTANWTMRQVLSDAIDASVTSGRDGKGTAIFWACTNGNFPISADEVCSHPRVCAVGRSTSTDLDDGSGFGPELEFLAPGVDVLIPASGNGYAARKGTSFAAPCAAAVAALALSQNKQLTAAALRDLMRSSCDKIGPLPYINGRNPRFGHGRVNAREAVEQARALAGIV